MDRMKLEVEYDQLKHQLTAPNQRGAPMVDPPASVRPPFPPQTQEVPFDSSKTRLMERKQQQWRQENGTDHFLPFVLICRFSA